MKLVYNEQEILRRSPLFYYYVKSTCASTICAIGAILLTLIDLFFLGEQIYFMVTGPYVAVPTYIGLGVDGFALINLVLMLITALGSVTIYLRWKIYLIIIFALLLAFNLFGIGELTYYVINSTSQEGRTILFENLAVDTVAFLLGILTYVSFFNMFTKHDDIRFAPLPTTAIEEKAPTITYGGPKNFYIIPQQF